MAALKKMLPIGLNMCTPGDQELISLAKMRYLLVRRARIPSHYCLSKTPPKDHLWFCDPQKDTDEEVKDHIQQNLHLRERVRYWKVSVNMWKVGLIHLRWHLPGSLRTPPSAGSSTCTETER